MKNNKNVVLGCRTMTNASAVVGNITSTIGEWITNQFPKGYIKKIHISEFFIPLTSMIDKNNPTIHKYGNQTLYIQPTWDPASLSYDLPRWHKANEFVLGSRRRNYNIVLEDWVNNTFIYSVPDRFKVNFQCRLKLKTYMQGLDVAHMLSNIFDIGGYRYLNNVRLQTELPIMLTKPICLKQGFDYTTDEGKKQLAEYLNENSYHGIQEKRNLGNGNRMYAYSYSGNILLHFPDQPEIVRNLDSLSVGETLVDFSFSAEFWTPANFLFETDNIDEKEVRTFNEIETIDENSLLMTLYIPIEYVSQFRNGKHLLYTEEFYPDVNVEYDNLNFAPILNPGVIEIVKLMRSQGYKIDNTIEVLVSAGSKLLYPEEYVVDWDNFTLKTNSPMVNTTYRIIIYADISKLNEIDQQIHPDNPLNIVAYTLRDKEI